VSKGRCYPSMLAYDYGALYGTVFGDTGCTNQLAYGLQSLYQQYFGRATGPGSPMGIFSPANVKYGVRSDGGVAGIYGGQLVHATRHLGTVYSRLSDGGCAPSQNDAGFDFYVMGADAPETDFAEMTVTIDP